MSHQIFDLSFLLDYGVEKHRFAIGHSLVFLKHLEAGSFKNNSEAINKFYTFFEKRCKTY
jgi:hypothetical protein